MELQSARQQRWEIFKKLDSVIRLPSFILLVYTTLLNLLLYWFYLPEIVKPFPIAIALTILTAIVAYSVFIKTFKRIISIYVLPLVITSLLLITRFFIMIHPIQNESEIISEQNFRHNCMVSFICNGNKTAAFIDKDVKNREITVSGKPKEIRPDTDFNIFLLRKGITHSAFVKTTKRQNASFRKKLRHRVDTSLIRIFPKEEYALIKALLFGDKSSLSRQTLHLYKKAGLLHLLAASGMHVAIVSGSIFFLAGAISGKKSIALIMASTAVILYTFITELPVSLLRAAIMFWIYAFFVLLRKGKNAINALFFSGVFIQIIDPSDIFSLGFQLSFGATLGILLFYKDFLEILPKIPLKLSQSIALSLSAQLSVIPLLFFSLGEFNPASIISTATASPLLLFFIYSSVLKIFFFWFSFAVPYLSSINSFFYKALELNTIIFSKANLNCRPESFMALFLPSMALLGSLFLPSSKKIKKSLVITALLFMYTVPIIYNTDYFIYNNWSHNQSILSDKDGNTTVIYKETSAVQIANELNKRNIKSVTLQISSITPKSWVAELIRLYPVKRAIFVDILSKKDYLLFTKKLSQENISYKTILPDDYRHLRAKKQKTRAQKKQTRAPK
ncbi:MAG: ComEC/Rec2 family competence protein [Spirochaetes bacterium]|nr:ComEC/Rec2 family competence protein [Spirochaetota bacterium]MBN2770945.1 ComEC/Rec2 family competence protein [Spirochaetota bacterium]